MKRVGLTLLLTILLAMVFNGCGNNKIYNVNKHIINSKNTLTTIEKEILNAGKSLGWDMRVEKEGKIIGILVLRSHMATINITYNKENFKIYHMKSENLQYNEEKDTIHANYNSWIKNLENTINNYLDDLIMTNELIKKEKESSLDKLSASPNATGSKIIDIRESINSDSTIEEISQSILDAGKSLGWKMQVQEHGFILGRIVLRTHSATVKITYNKDKYNITYLTSTNLNYTKDYTIHRNYNGWITNLKNAINARLSI